MLLTTVRSRPVLTGFLLTALAVVAVFLWSRYQAGPQQSDAPPQRVRYEGTPPDTVAVAAAAWLADGGDLLVGGSWPDVDLVVLHEPREGAAERLSALRPTVVARGGRIGVIRPARVPTYHPELFGAGFRRAALLAEPADSPMWQRLGPELRGRLARSGPLPLESRVELAERFEALLDDRSLFVALSSFYDARTSTASEIMSEIPVRWQPLAQWLQHHFDPRGVFDPEGPALDALDVQALRRFNAICLSVWFSGEASGALGTLLPGPPGQLEAAAEQAQLRVGQVLPVAPGLEVVALELVEPSAP